MIWALGCGEGIAAGVGDGSDGTTEGRDPGTSGAVLFPSWDLHVVTSAWNVDGATFRESAAAIFGWVDGEILSTVGD